MKIISFDVGIKNMAYCIFDISNNTVQISDWKVLSLMEQETPRALCSFIIPPKMPKKKETKPCGHKAKYHTGTGEYFLCDKHAKLATKQPAKWLFPEPRFRNVKKMKIDELITMATHELGLSNLPAKKPEIVKTIETHLETHCLKSAVKKTAKAGEVDIISLGQNMKKVFQEVLPNDIDFVLIENQISPLANRMKTIQGMLAQFFIMKYDKIGIEFISSANKLKMFSISKEKKVEKIESKESKEEKDKTQSQVYKSHKKDGIFYCNQVLEKNAHLQKELWIECEQKKKDDLADCFLQGIWWIKRENLGEILV
jgi:hypothetical protein